MKHRKITSAVIASALLLPIAAFGGPKPTAGSSAQSQTDYQQDQSAQPGQSGADQSGQYGAQSSSQMDQAAQADPQSTWQSETEQSDAFGADQTARTWGATGASASAQLQRVEQSELETHVTASDLIGKKVKDRNGEEVGKVKDISLGSSLSGSGAAGLFGSSTGSASGAQGTVGISGSADPAADEATIGASADLDAAGSESSDIASAGMAGISAAASSLGQSELNVVIEVDGEDAMVSIPASEVSYDQQQEELTVQRSSMEITRVAQGEPSTFESTIPAE